MATAWFQQPLFSLFSRLNFLLFKKFGGNNQSLIVGLFLWTAAVASTDKHASSSAITVDITGNVVLTMASFVFFISCEELFIFPFFVVVFVIN